MYNLEQLKAFAAVCEYGSMSAAARKLGKAQSGVSLAISNLEIELNQTLFERSKNSATLTENGRALLPSAQAVLQQLQYFEQKVEALAQKEEDYLSIAIEDCLWEDRLLTIFVELGQRFPHTNVNLHAVSAHDICPLIKKGELHIGVTYQHHAHLEPQAQWLGQQCFITVAAPNHPLAQLTQVQPDDLAHYCQLTHRSAEMPAHSPQVWHINSYYLLAALAENGIGWATIPDNILRDDYFSTRLVPLKLKQELIPQPIAISAQFSANHKVGKVTQFLLARLKEALA